MTRAIAADLVAPVTPLGRLRDLVGIYNELAKARLSTLVVLTAVVGFVLGTAGAIDWLGLLVMAVGVGLAAGSANTFNQVIEVENDRRMERTKDRPLPSGRISRLHATFFAIGGGLLGAALLGVFFGLWPALLAGLNIALYAAVYTPLKTRTTMNTVVGAVVGAVPPAIGWVAASGSMSAGGWILATILFVWQMPHFLALAWMYREDYERGGYRMLPAIDPSGQLTARTSMLYSLCLLPAGLAVTLVGVSGWISGVASLALGGWMVWLALRMLNQRTDAAARKLFLASVLYLPLLMGAMVVDRQGQSDRFSPASWPTASQQIEAMPIAALPDKP